MGKRNGWQVERLTKKGAGNVEKYADLAMAAAMAKHNSIFNAGKWAVIDLDRCTADAAADPLVVYQKGVEK